MPPQGSSFAESFDRLYQFLTIASFIACLLVIGGMFFFAIKYRRRSSSDKTAYITHNTTLEFLWSFIPFLIFIVVFVWGFNIFHTMRKAPSHALEIHVIGQKWSWDFLYKSGRRVSKHLYVPVNTPVKLIMTSKDVIHSFFIPAFRVKQDVLPNRYTSLWFEAIHVGEFHVFCTEYCGTGHSSMLAKVHVLPIKEYEVWLENDPYRGLNLTEVGEKIFETKCKFCHTLDGSKLVGPSFKDLWKGDRIFTDGSKEKTSEDYLRESILNPNAKVVSGFQQGVMPNFQGQLSENELASVIEYLKSLKGSLK